MRQKNTKITELEPQVNYRVLLLIRYTSQERNKLVPHAKAFLPMLSYQDADGVEYNYQECVIKGPYLSPNIAKREAKNTGYWERHVYPDDYETIIEECDLPQWRRSEITDVVT